MIACAAGAAGVLAAEAANGAAEAVSGAAGLVIDRTGQVIDMAAAGAGTVSEAAASAMQLLQEKGKTIMRLSQDAVAEIDLNDPQNWDEAKRAVEAVIEKAYEEGELGEGIDKEAVEIVIRIVFGSLVYGTQYSSGVISLGSYAASMSEMIIKEGLPTGVGFLVSQLPFKIPLADYYAKEATIYLISKAYHDQTKTEAETETVIETETDLQ